MRVEYCDLCGQPIHGKSWVLAILQSSFSTKQELVKYASDLNQTINRKEICDHCKLTVDALFEEKKVALKKALEEIKEIYNLLPKDKK